MALGFGFVSAQEKEDMAFGAKAGLNLATITNADGSSTLVGFHVGFFAEFMLGENFAVQPELLYSTQGAEFDDGDLKLDYITIPVMLKYYVADSFSLEIGPQVGFLVSAEEVGVDIKDDVKSTDFGLNFGAGYDVTPNLIIGVRYNLGLNRWQEALFPGEPESENSVFQISLGYRF
ncbi:porin family protein [Flavobacterium sp. XS2P39]|uniref:porin family protein n=1 Tax=Flavobacterium sp. XS2P39 TaxID=3401725 RepID=UPI003AADEF5A